MATIFIAGGGGGVGAVGQAPTYNSNNNIYLKSNIPTILRTPRPRKFCFSETHLNDVNITSTLQMTLTETCSQ